MCYCNMGEVKEEKLKCSVKGEIKKMNQTMKTNKKLIKSKEEKFFLKKQVLKDNKVKLSQLLVFTF